MVAGARRTGLCARQRQSRRVRGCRSCSSTAGRAEPTRAYLDVLALADERAVILYDQLDSGRSDRPNNPANWTVGRFTDEVGAVARGLGVRRWHVVGHSWGGTIALEYGARRPAELAGLVLASPLISTRSWIADANALRAPAARATSRRRLRPATLRARSRRRARKRRSILSRVQRPRAASDGMRDYAARQKPRARAATTRLYNAMWGSSEFVSTGTLKDYDGEPLLAKLDGQEHAVHRRPI